MPVGKGSIARATNASNGNIEIKEKIAREKQVQELPSILTNIPVTQIIEVPASWRKKTSGRIHKMEDLIKSIQKFGMLEPVILRRLGEDQFQLLSGYHRLQAIIELGLETISARVFDGISDAQAKNIYQDLHNNEAALLAENQFKINQEEEHQKQRILADVSKNENIHELKFKVVTTLSRDMPDYLL